MNLLITGAWRLCCCVLIVTIFASTAFCQSLENLLMKAIKENDTTSFRNAVLQGADIFYRDKYRYTPLNQAILGRRFAMFSSMVLSLEPGPDNAIHFTDALAYAVNALDEDPRYFDMLLRRDANPFQILRGLSRAGQFERVAAYLPRYPDRLEEIDRMNLPLEVVVASGLHPRNLEAAVPLLERLKNLGFRFDRPDNFGETAAQKAAKFSLPSLLQLVDVTGEYAEQVQTLKPPTLERRLFDAAEYNDLAAAERLLEKGADPNGVNDDIANRSTPILAMAAAEGSLEMIELLLKHGAQFERAAYQVSPLTDSALRSVYKASEAAWGGKGKKKEEWLKKREDGLVVLDFLLARGLDINSSTAQGLTAQHRAAGHPDLFILESLLKRGADPNAQSDQGATPLMFAVMKNNFAAVEFLIRNGADAQLVDKKGLTAADMAFQRKSVAVLRLVDTAGKYDDFVKDYTPSSDSPLLGTWSNKKSGFKTVVLNFDESGQGWLMTAIGMRINYIWKFTSDLDVELFFMEQKMLQGRKGQKSDEERTMRGRFDAEREVFYWQPGEKQMDDDMIFTRVDDDFTAVATPGKGEVDTTAKRLADAFHKMAERKSFYLLRGTLQQWPEKLFAQRELKGLVLVDNLLSEIPDDIGAMTQLTSLHLAGNKIRQISPEIGRLANLKELALAKNRLEVLPTELSGLPLRELDLSSNSLAGFAANFRFNSGLQLLKLSDNRLAEIDKPFDDCRELTELQLDQNELTELGGDWASLQRLKRITLSYNRFRKFPVLLSMAPALSSISLEGNKLKGLPNGLNLPQLTELNLANNLISELPADLSGFSSLTHLDLSNNRLTAFAFQLAQIKTLQYLRIGGNRIPRAQIEEFKKLAPHIRVRTD